MKKYTAGEGFTLIELLVVVSIIAVLSVISLNTYQGTQSKARDARRKQDIRQISTVLELYFQKKGNYIYTPTQNCTDSNSDLLYNNADIGATLNNQIPKDPSTGAKYCYFSLNNNNSYKLFAKLENCSDSDIIDKTNCQSASPNPYNFSVVSSDLQIAQAPTGSAAPNPTYIPSATATPTPVPASNPPCTAQKWYQDADGDGYGDPAVSVSACTQPASFYVTNNTDCYDGNALAHPGQTAFFPTDRGDGSFDYNCDNIQESQFGSNARFYTFDNPNFFDYSVNQWVYNACYTNSNYKAYDPTSLSCNHTVSIPNPGSWAPLNNTCGATNPHNNTNAFYISISTDTSLNQAPDEGWESDKECFTDTGPKYVNNCQAYPAVSAVPCR